MFPVPGWRSDRGDTLIEVLFAVGILGLAALSIMGGLMMSATTSGRDRGQSTSTAYVRDFAEVIESTVAGGGYNSNGSYSWTPPSGTASVVAAKCLTASSASTTSPVWGACPQSGDGGKAQLLTLSATAPNGSVESLTILVRKPCTAVTVADTC